MSGDFDKFKFLLRCASRRQGKLSPGEKAQIILGSVYGTHLTSIDEARQIVKQIEAEG